MRCRYFVISMDEETGHTSKEVVKQGFEIKKSRSRACDLRTPSFARLQK